MPPTEIDHCRELFYASRKLSTHASLYLSSYLSGSSVVLSHIALTVAIFSDISIASISSDFN